MKIASPLFSAVVALTFAITPLAHSQEQHPPAPGGAGEHHRPAPPPTNLKVLPKDTTGDQVHEIMHKWEAELGAECTTCHTVDPNRKMPNGRPALNFADDSKAEKNSARLMYRMVEDINKNYLDKVADTDHDKGHEKAEALSCGTCHRGHVHPPVFIPPKEDHDHDHPAPHAEAKP